MRYRVVSVILVPYACLCGLWSAQIVRAEATAQPGPHAANFRLQNNGSAIDEYTGTLNWSYDLLTVPGRGGLDFPIRLTYHPGIGCEQEASWVGLGFGLNLGSIERTVVYIPDDMMLYHHRGPGDIHQHAGWLFHDGYDPWPDSGFIDGPDMWTVALADIGTNLMIATDTTNRFYDGAIPYGPAGHRDRAIDESPAAPWLSRHQRSFGLVARVGPKEYIRDSGNFANNERQRHCYVSPRMGDTVQGRVYDYAGEIQLAFNDSTGGFADNSGVCSVYVYKQDSGQTAWTVSGPFAVNAAYSSWLGTGISIQTGDRFALLVKSRRFVFERWRAARVDYEVEFTDWGGYYVHPEIYEDPYSVWHDGFTPSISSFTITSDDGTRYDFRVADYVRATTREKVEPGIEPDGYAEDSVSIAFNFSYKLTRILSSDYVDSDAIPGPSPDDLGSWVVISYDTIPVRVNYANKALAALDGDFNRFGVLNIKDSL